MIIIEDDDRYLEVVNEISSSVTLDELTLVLSNMRTAYSLENIVYHAVYIPEAPSFHPLLILTYDPEWVERYRLRDYFKIDPVVLGGTKSFLPLDWSEVDHESDSARNFFMEADRYSVGRQGITLPVRGPGGERALFTITSNLSQAEWLKCRFLYMREFQTIAHYFHDQAVQIGGYRKAIAILPSLSRRELECLELMAHGLVPKRAANHLNVSDSAVRLYLRSACRKLGCASVHQAVAKMITFELIHPLL